MKIEENRDSSDECSNNGKEQVGRRTDDTDRSDDDHNDIFYKLSYQQEEM